MCVKSRQGADDRGRRGEFPKLLPQTAVAAPKVPPEQIELPRGVQRQVDTHDDALSDVPKVDSQFSDGPEYLFTETNDHDGFEVDVERLSDTGAPDLSGADSEFSDFKTPVCHATADSPRWHTATSVPSSNCRNNSPLTRSDVDSDPPVSRATRCPTRSNVCGGHSVIKRFHRGSSVSRDLMLL